LKTFAEQFHHVFFFYQCISRCQFVIYSLFTSTSNITTISYCLSICTKLRQMFGGNSCGLRSAMTVSDRSQWHWLKLLFVLHKWCKLED
jgi:hypothetical protein